MNEGRKMTIEGCEGGFLIEMSRPLITSGDPIPEEPLFLKAVANDLEGAIEHVRSYFGRAEEAA